MVYLETIFAFGSMYILFCGIGVEWVEIVLEVMTGDELCRKFSHWFIL